MLVFRKFSRTYLMDDLLHITFHPKFPEKTFTCLKSAVKTIEKGVTYVQS